MESQPIGPSLSPNRDTSGLRLRATFAAITVLVAAACTALGVWQLNRHFARKARNAADIAQVKLPVVDLNSVWPDQRVLYRRTVAAGRYDFDREFVIRL